MGEEEERVRGRVRKGATERRRGRKRGRSMWMGVGTREKSPHRIGNLVLHWALVSRAQHQSRLFLLDDNDKISFYCYLFIYVNFLLILKKNSCNVKS